MLLKNQVPVFVFSKRERESDYVGTEVDWVYTQTVFATVHPAEIEVRDAACGTYTAEVLRLYCAPVAEIDENCAFSLAAGTTPTHTVRSVQSFNRLKVITAEAVML